jgi:hypothetical protein
MVVNLNIAAKVNPREPPTCKRRLIIVNPTLAQLFAHSRKRKLLFILV